ncbi:hypothetical protein EVAR_54594_1 [Eumeta japonica]|uniref:Uncharacterized protein n=1 Tax=Eumeta variegata TaxID=151549 RepID=A0A4C1YNP9_EUMVA|nr:hypothetical protein EVAR_54594_1 [Eumeta japonica]
MLWPTWLQHVNEPTRPVRCHNFQEYRCEVSVSSVAYRPVSEWPTFPASPAGSQARGSLLLHQPTLSSTRYSIPTQEADNALVIPLELRVFMGSANHLYYSSSRDRLPLDNARKK